MTFNNLLRSGWIHALFIAMIAYPVGSMIQKYIISYTSGNILVCTSVFMMSAAAALLVFAGPGPLASTTLKRFETWLYAFLQIITYVMFLYTLNYVSATQGATLGMMGGIFTLIISVLFLKQNITNYELLGGTIIIVGFYSIIHQANLPMESKILLSVIVVVRAVLHAIQKLITEVHKTNRQAVFFKDQLRVTGFIMAVAGFLFLVFLVIVAISKQYYEISIFKSFPTLAEFINFDSYILSIILGVILISSSKYCEFYAGKTIGAKYLSSITSLQVVLVYLIEKVMFNLGLIDDPIVSGDIVFSLTCVIIGNFIISIAGFAKDLKFIKKGEKNNTLANIGKV